MTTASIIFRGGFLAASLLWPSAQSLASSSGAAEPVAPANAWPMFRGTRSLNGVTAARLPDTLQLKWSVKTDGPVKGAAAVVEGVVYAGSEDGTFRALRLADGAKVWEFKADGPIVSSPLVLNGHVYFGSAGTNVYALNSKDGTLAWTYGTEGEVKSSPTPFRSPDGKEDWLVIGGYDNRLHCLSAETGKTNWVHETSNFINGAPAVGDGMTAFGGCDEIVHVIRLSDGTVLKEIEAGAYIIGSAAVLGGMAYVGHYRNEFLAVDLTKGEIAWRYRDRNFPYGASPAVTSDRVLFGGRDKRLHAVNRSTGESIWVFPTRGAVESSPVVAGDKVVFGSDDGRVYVVGLADGKERWNYEIGQPVQSSAAVVDGHVVIGADDGGIYCFSGPK
ncbi:MAG: PQQ-binding-like beta-propeller repeat protein [Limisphaerales bacterium]